MNSVRIVFFLFLLGVLYCFAGCSSPQPPEELTPETIETWVQEDAQTGVISEQIVFTLRGGTIVNGYGHSLGDDGARYDTRITPGSILYDGGIVSCSLTRSDGKNGSMRIFSRENSIMRATLYYLSPGQVQNFMPVMRTFKKQ